LEKVPRISFVAVTFLALLFAACGSGGGPPEENPTLGITSIQKMGATAIPNPAVSSGKSTSAKRLTKGFDLLFEEKLAHAAVGGTCPTETPTPFGIPGGRILLDEVFMILDEVQFNAASNSNTPGDEKEPGPFGLDLLNTDPNVEQSINISVPSGNYSNVRFRVKRVEDDTSSGTNQVPQFLIDKIRDPDSAAKRRPSVWIKGWISLDEAPATCRDFTFVTDRRWEETIPFNQFSGGDVNAVLELKLEGAFNAALNSLGKKARDLQFEIGQAPSPPLKNSVEVLGDPFLDGRKKDPEHGTPIAEAIADQLPFHFRVLVQRSDAIDFDDFAPDTSLIDKSAEPVSQDISESDFEDCTQDSDCP